MKTTKQKTTYVGNCHFSPLIHVTDPCYDRSVTCAAWDIIIKEGEYKCFATVQNEGCWGDRVAEIKILHKDVVFPTEHPTNYDIGVDSGQAGFFDDSIYPYVPEGVDKHKYPEFDYCNEEGFYKKACNLTHGEGKEERFGIGFNNKGFCSSSGFGDGGYSLYFYKENGEIVGAKIIFIGEDDEDWGDEEDD